MIDVAELFNPVTYVAFSLFLVVVFCCYRLMQKRNYLILIVWPILIYFCGPALTMLFADAPVLKKYVFPETVLAETLMFLAYFVALLVADKLFDISSMMRISISSPAVRRLTHGPAFQIIFGTVVALALFLQIKLLAEFGSLLSGSYVIEEVAEGLIPYWGFLAGLYEVIFLLFVLFLLSGRHSRRYQSIVIGIYLVTAVLRAFGGTRLVLINELAVLVIIFHLRERVSTRRLVILASAALLVGSALGFLRSQDTSNVAFLGPAYGIVMEGGLNALTLNIAYKVQESGFVSENGDALRTLAFVALSAIPSFARFGVTQSDLDALSPYALPVDFGFDTAWPVGSMSGFATLCYLCSYPILASVILALTIGLLFRYAPAGNLKRIVILVFSVNAIHFWRDPIDISTKLVVQGIVCAIVLMCLSSRSQSKCVPGGPPLPRPSGIAA